MNAINTGQLMKDAYKASLATMNATNTGELIALPASCAVAAPSNAPYNPSLAPGATCLYNNFPMSDCGYFITGIRRVCVCNEAPSDMPSHSLEPSNVPSLKPSETPSQKPSDAPSMNPSKEPSDVPSLNPSQSPADYVLGSVGDSC